MFLQHEKNAQAGPQQTDAAAPLGTKPHKKKDAPKPNSIAAVLAGFLPHQSDESKNNDNQSSATSMHEASSEDIQSNAKQLSSCAIAVGEVSHLDIQSNARQLSTCAVNPDAASVVSATSNTVLPKLWQAQLRSGKLAARVDAVLPSSTSQRAGRLQSKLQGLGLQIAHFQEQVQVA